MKVAPFDPDRHLDNPEVIRAYITELREAIKWLEAENATLREALNDARMSPTMRILKIGERELQLRRQRERKK